MFSESRITERHGVFEFPLLAVRGGTSTGLIIPAKAMPAAAALRDELLRHLMGVPLQGESRKNRQLTGLGRGVPTSNKVFLVDTEPYQGRLRLVSTLAQFAAHTSAIDWSVNCGNLSSALPLWAWDAGLLTVAGGSDEGWIDIRNTNTGVVTAARIKLQADGALQLASIPGVDGLWPAVDLFLQSPVGKKTGHVLPTGKPLDRVAGVEVSCIDVAVPMVLLRAADLGKTGQESIAELESDAEFMQALRHIWIEAALLMQLKTVDGLLMSREAIANSETIPKVAILAEPRQGGQLGVRYFTPQQAHASLAVSGACCIAAACLVPGTLAQGIAQGVEQIGASFSEVQISLENPAGLLRASIMARQTADGVEIESAAYQRNAQILQRGRMPVYRASAALRAWLAAEAACPGSAS